jgi:Fe-Mn family superoxide dismutase
MPYGYGELEPTISGEIMEIHHKKHHAAYVNNLNIALEKYTAAEKSNNIAEMISLQSAIKFNGNALQYYSLLICIRRRTRQPQYILDKSCSI